MVITVVFEESKPTEKMWDFAKAVAESLDLELPKYTYEDVSAFLEMYSEEFYQFMQVVTYASWKYAFWMDPRPFIEDD